MEHNPVHGWWGPTQLPGQVVGRDPFLLWFWMAGYKATAPSNNLCCQQEPAPPEREQKRQAWALEAAREGQGVGMATVGTEGRGLWLLKVIRVINQIILELTPSAKLL